MRLGLIRNVVIVGLLLVLALGRFRSDEPLRPVQKDVTSGALRIRGPGGHAVGDCPLEHTDVVADIAGFVGRVRVRQSFHNPLNHPIEAVYVFPLPHDAAVDDMTMVVGTRRIVGRVKPKEEARHTYEQAKAAGKTASLLDQERPNIFTQSVANIAPGERVDIEIRYVETLPYKDGVCEFVFPMVVGPRYIPGTAAGFGDIARAQDTDRVPDGSRINPTYGLPPRRAGHDVSLTVNIDGGSELFDVKSELHPVDVRQSSPGRAVVTLQNLDEIPNRDFILRYRTATEQINDAFFVHNDSRGAFFTLALQPPRRVPAEQARPKEMIFVIDRSGSQAGFPIEKAKEVMRSCIESMNPRDTFNLISFSDDVYRFFERPQANSPQNRARALAYLAGISADGGTEMLPAVRAALDQPADPRRLRIVVFLTDGFVGNDFEIIDAIRKHAGSARFFVYGIGDSVNRFLIDGMARAGRGESEVVTLVQQADAAAQRLHDRIQSPVLTDIRLDWGRLKVSDVYPRDLPDLFSDRPLMIHGRLNGPPNGVITLRGQTAQGPFERRIALHAPSEADAHDALPSLWARAKVGELMTEDMAGLQSGHMRGDLKREITDLGVRFRLMTQFTSFVAVDERVRLQLQPAARVNVPAEAPEGVSQQVAAATNGTLLAQARAGDPLIRVQAPPNARQVIALLPGGEIKRLAFDQQRNEWQARFDIPTYTPEGDYFVSVVIVLENGSRTTLTLRYRVDTMRPTGVARALRAPESGASVSLELQASEDTARVAALLPWGEKVDLRPAPEVARRFVGRALAPPAYRARPFDVTFLMTDRAHNRTMLTVETAEERPRTTDHRRPSSAVGRPSSPSEVGR